MTSIDHLIDPAVRAEVGARLSAIESDHGVRVLYACESRSRGREHLRGDRVRLKKYLYVLRPLLATLWIEQGRGVAPMRFRELVEGVIDDPALRSAIDDLLIVKRAAMESEHGKPLPAISAFIDAELTRLESASPPVPRKTDFSVLDRLLMDTVMQSRQ